MSTTSTMTTSTSSATPRARCTRRCSSATSPWRACRSIGRRRDRGSSWRWPSVTATNTSTHMWRGRRCSTPSGGPPDMAKEPMDRAETQARRGRESKADRTYDAIVIGGGHNGLTNGAYLAKAGLRTLVLERRHLVGGAAITEELRPGFWFTTFSYALSLLRPDIVQDLELVKHGFMPILMPTTFCPMENGDYHMGQDHQENQQEIARHSKHDA